MRRVIVIAIVGCLVASAVPAKPPALRLILTHTGDRFRPYTEGKVTLSLTVEGATVNAAAEGPERPGVFRLNVTPTKVGSGRIVVD